MGPSRGNHADGYDDDNDHDEDDDSDDENEDDLDYDVDDAYDDDDDDDGIYVGFRKLSWPHHVVFVTCYMSTVTCFVCSSLQQSYIPNMADNVIHQNLRQNHTLCL